MPLKLSSRIFCLSLKMFFVTITIDIRKKPAGKVVNSQVRKVEQKMKLCTHFFFNVRFSMKKSNTSSEGNL